MASNQGSLVVDVDSHVFEPPAIWSEYLDPEVTEAARRVFWLEDGAVMLNGVPATPLNRSRINRQAVWRPGMTLEQIGGLDPSVDPGVNPGAADPASRLADMDKLGIDHQIVLPTLFAEYFPCAEDVTVAVALARAYNDWANDLAASGDGRLHPAAVLPTQDPEAAVAELERVAGLGFRSVALRPMFYRVPDATPELNPLLGQPGPVNPNGVYIDHAAFRPLWQRIEELGLVACVHPSLGITNREATSEGSYVERVSAKLGIGHTVAEPVAYLQDNAMFVVVAAFHGLLEDYPRLRLALLHSGAAMVLLALEKAETYLWLAPSTMVGDNPVSLEPEEVFRRSRVLVGFDGWESSVLRLPDFFATRGAWGSRYPNHDTSTPAEALALCEQYEVGPETVERLLGRNAADLFGLPVG